jgi:hypothetical protein
MSEKVYDFNDFMGSITEDLSRMVKESYKAPETFMEHWGAFRAAVDWGERWIQGLLVFHAVIFVLFLVFRNSVDFQTGLFLFVCFLTMLSERINTACALHWRSFATQNYFDEHGTFTSTMWSMPLLLIGFAQLINFLRLTSSALITYKRLELGAKKKKEREDGQGQVETKKTK